MTEPVPALDVAPASPARAPRRFTVPLVDALVVGIALAIVTALRWRLLHAGPDLDGDSVGHAFIGRRFLEEPGNIAIHWVWLPLWHLVHAASAFLGGGLELVRRWNVVISLAPPCILYVTLRARGLRHAAGESTSQLAIERALPVTAAVLLALWPLEISLGESGQPEMLFQTLVLFACLAWEQRRGALAGVALAFAVMLRYEAWLIPPVFLLLWIARRPRRPLDALSWLLPGATALAWCVLHRVATGEWLQFVRLNHEYVAEALPRLHASWREGHSVVYTAGYYVAVVPYRSVGWLVLLAVPGAFWCARRTPRSYGLVLLALLGFVTYGWLRRQHLGLARHFVAVIPFYATLIAAGALVVFVRIGARVRDLIGRGPADRALATTGAALLLTALLVGNVVPAFRELRVLHARAFASERAAAQVLARAGADGRTVFCDVSRLEVYSNLPSRQFVRDPISSLTAERIHRIAPAGALIATEPGHARGLRAITDVLYEDPVSIVLRVRSTEAAP